MQTNTEKAFDVEFNIRHYVSVRQTDEERKNFNIQDLSQGVKTQVKQAVRTGMLSMQIIDNSVLNR